MASDRGRIRSFEVVAAEDPRRIYRIHTQECVSGAQAEAFRNLTGQPHPAAVDR